MEDKFIEPMYYDGELLTKPPQPVYRSNFGSSRYYYSIDPDTLKILRYPSVTTIIGKMMPTPEYLIKWQAEHGIKRANEIAKQKADYGTLLHICCTDYIVDREFDFDTLDARIDTFIRTKKITYKTDFWEYELKKDLLAFHQFANDYNLKIIAAGLMIFSKKHGIAGELDLVVEMDMGTGINGTIIQKDIKNKTVKRVIAIIDIKSGRHGFYPNNEAQLHLYKMLWNDYLPHIGIDALYNWSPKEWTTTPDYNLKNQTNSIERKKVPEYIKLFKMEEENIDFDKKKYVTISGKIYLGYSADNNLKLETFEERHLRIHGVKKAAIDVLNIPSQEPINEENMEETSQELIKDVITLEPIEEVILPQEAQKSLDAINNLFQ